MTDILELPFEELANIKNGKTWILLKPKRDIKKDDTVVFENGIDQHTTIVVDAQTTPGLMKGWVLLTLEH
jgi:hypothetical protein